MLYMYNYYKITIYNNDIVLSTFLYSSSYEFIEELSAIPMSKNYIRVNVDVLHIWCNFAKVWPRERWQNKQEEIYILYAC